MLEQRARSLAPIAEMEVDPSARSRRATVQRRYLAHALAGALRRQGIEAVPRKTALNLLGHDYLVDVTTAFGDLIAGFDQGQRATIVRPDGSRWTLAVEGPVTSAAATIARHIPELIGDARDQVVWVQALLQFAPGETHIMWTHLPLGRTYGWERIVSPEQLNRAEYHRSINRAKLPQADVVMATRLFYPPEIAQNADRLAEAITSHIELLTSKIRRGQLTIEG
ncbi:hypothetical protein [Allokutzneria multivorans]|uniref:hypothetical protein n=1 Tax=Allokutzneria multivorans TaxID=1142134 RepID=UPI0031EF63FF